MNVLFIDAHPVSACCRENGICSFEEPFFSFIFLRFFKSCMIETGCTVSETCIEFSCHVFGVCTCAAEYEHWSFFFRRNAERFLLFGICCAYFIVYVRPVAFRPDNVCFSAEEHLCNAVQNFRRGGGSERRNDRYAEFFQNSSECEICGAERITPFRDAVCFINSYMRDSAL